jgi:ubiquinone/menaquinone biosynthesis C-methylase UbiE
MPSLHAEELKKEYQRIAGGYAKRNARIQDFPDVLASAKKFVTMLPKKAKVLDLGCGNGRDAEWFASRGFEMTLFDLSDDLLAFAKKRVPSATILQGDMTDIPFELGSFEGVWANASLLHLTKEELKAVLQTIYKIIVPGGILFASFKKGSEEKYLEEAKYDTVTKRFFSLVDIVEIRDLLADVGFQNLKIEEIGEYSAQPWIHVFATT